MVDEDGWDALDVDKVAYNYTLRKAGSHRHQIECQIPSGLDDDATMEALRGMHENAALESFVEGKDYRWDGCSVLMFRDKAHVALFNLFLP